MGRKKPTNQLTEDLTSSTSVRTNKPARKRGFFSSHFFSSHATQQRHQQKALRAVEMIQASGPSSSEIPGTPSAKDVLANMIKSPWDEDTQYAGLHTLRSFPPAELMEAHKLLEATPASPSTSEIHNTSFPLPDHAVTFLDRDALANHLRPLEERYVTASALTTSPSEEATPTGGAHSRESSSGGSNTPDPPPAPAPAPASPPKGKGKSKMALPAGEYLPTAIAVSALEADNDEIVPVLMPLPMTNAQPTPSEIAGERAGPNAMLSRPDVDVIDVIVSAMITNRKNIQIQEQACALIATLAWALVRPLTRPDDHSLKRRDQSRKGSKYGGGGGTSGGSRRRKHLDAEAAAAAEEAAAACARVRDRAFKGGVVTAIVQAMVTHNHEMDLVYNGSLALWALTDAYDASEGRHQAAAAGAIQHICEVLQRRQLPLQNWNIGRMLLCALIRNEPALRKQAKKALPRVTLTYSLFMLSL